MNDPAPFLAIEFARACAGILIDAWIEPVEQAVRPRGPDVMRHGFRQGAEFLLALPQRAFRLHLIGNVGMRADQRFRRIVFPQIVRTSLPALVNEMSLLIKVTPVLAVVGVVDITRAAVRIGAETYEPLPPFLVAVAIYAPIVFGLVSLQRWIERRQVRTEALA